MRVVAVESNRAIVADSNATSWDAGGFEYPTFRRGGLLASYLRAHAHPRCPRQTEKAGREARHGPYFPKNYCGLAGGVAAFFVVVPVVLLVVVAAGFLAGVAGCLGSTIFTCVIFGGLKGRSLRGSVARRVICFTNSGLSH